MTTPGLHEDRGGPEALGPGGARLARHLKGTLRKPMAYCSALVLLMLSARPIPRNILPKKKSIRVGCVQALACGSTTACAALLMNPVVQSYLHVHGAIIDMMDEALRRRTVRVAATLSCAVFCALPAASHDKHPPTPADDAVARSGGHACARPRRRYSWYGWVFDWQPEAHRTLRRFL